MSDIKDRMKFNSGTDKVTKSVADAVSEVLNSGQTPKSRFEQQAELMGYPSQDKPEVAESFTKELQELKKAVNDDKAQFINTARQAKKDGKKEFTFNGKTYPCTVGEETVDEDASNDKSDDGEGLDKANPKSAKKKFKDRKDKDIDNDGDVDSSDKFLHKKRKAISKAIDKKEDASEGKYDARSKSFKETLRRLGYVKEKSLIYTNKKSGK
tara:strand:+ start:21219 stop:21851 length:633 start_codon:yes stop_codon:yes gene_type:complete